jgi:hypothetical protein
MPVMADPKNKWSQPAAPPAPMFFGKKERELVKQVNDELAERVIGQAVAYYPISLEESNFNTTYGEAVEKVSLPPVRVYAYVVVENEQSNEKYGYEYTNKLTVNFHRARLTADQDLYVRVGDYLQYGEKFYEIVKTYNDTRYLFGQVEHKFQISAECVEARPGAFRVEKSLTRPTALSGSSADTSGPAPRSAPYPPLDATYITVAADPKLPNERVLTAGAGIILTDAGPGGAMTIAATAGGDGIFTAVSPSAAYTTSSATFGAATTPTDTVTIAGTFSGSGVATFGNSLSSSGDVAISGAYHGDGQYLANISADGVDVTSSTADINYPMVFTEGFQTDGSLGLAGNTTFIYNPNNNIISSSAALQVVGNSIIGGTLSVSGSQTLAGAVSSSAGAVFVNSVSSSGDLSVTGNVHAAQFYGGGGNLTGISADAIDVTSSIGDINYPIVFTEGFQSDGTLGLGGNTALVYNPNIGGSGDGLLSSSATLQIVEQSIFGNSLAVSGNLGVGTDPASNVVLLEVAADQGNNGGISVSQYDNSFSVNGAELVVKRARGTQATPLTVADGDTMGELDFFGHDGTTFRLASSIVSQLDNTVGASQVPANLLFNTADSAGTLTERLRITSGGFISGSGTLHNVGATTLGSTLNVTGAVSGAVGITGSSGIFDVQVSSSAFHGNTAYFSSDVQIAGTLIGASPLKISGAIDIVDDLGNVISGLGTSIFSSSAGAMFVQAISSSNDLAVSGNIHATTYYGDGSNLTGIDSASGSARQYSSTGMETSGYLKVSGSATFASGITHNRAAITAASYTILVTDYYIGADPTSNAITLTLPAAATAGGGKTYIIKDEGGTAAINNITIDGDGSETVDGVTTVDITSPYGALNLYSDGSNWFVY